MRTLSGTFLPFKYKYQKPCDKYPSVKYLEQKALKVFYIYRLNIAK